MSPHRVCPKFMLIAHEASLFGHDHRPVHLIHSHTNLFIHFHRKILAKILSIYFLLTFSLVTLKRELIVTRSSQPHKVLIKGYPLTLVPQFYIIIFIVFLATTKDHSFVIFLFLSSCSVALFLSSVSCLLIVFVLLICKTS